VGKAKDSHVQRLVVHSALLQKVRLNYLSGCALSRELSKDKVEWVSLFEKGTHWTYSQKKGKPQRIRDSIKEKAYYLLAPV